VPVHLLTFTVVVFNILARYITQPAQLYIYSYKILVVISQKKDSHNCDIV